MSSHSFVKSASETWPIWATCDCRRGSAIFEISFMPASVMPIITALRSVSERFLTIQPAFSSLSSIRVMSGARETNRFEIWRVAIGVGCEACKIRRMLYCCGVIFQLEKSSSSIIRNRSYVRQSDKYASCCNESNFGGFFLAMISNRSTQKYSRLNKYCRDSNFKALR